MHNFIFCPPENTAVSGQPSFCPIPLGVYSLYESKIPHVSFDFCNFGHCKHIFYSRIGYAGVFWRLNRRYECVGRHSNKSYCVHVQFKYFNISRPASRRGFSRYSRNQTLCKFQFYARPLGAGACSARVSALYGVRRNQLRECRKRKTDYNDGDELVGMFELLEMFELLDCNAPPRGALLVRVVQGVFGCCTSRVFPSY